MLAAAQARARKAHRSEAATAPPDSSMQYSRLKIYVEAILEYGVGKLANEIFEQTDGSLPSAAAGMGEATKVSSNAANEEQVAANTAAYAGGSNTSAMIGLMDDFRPRELVARCARRDRELIRSALVSYCKIVEMVQAVAGRGGTFALHIKSSLIVLGGWATAGDVAYDAPRPASSSPRRNKTASCSPWAAAGTSRASSRRQSSSSPSSWSEWPWTT